MMLDGLDDLDGLDKLDGSSNAWSLNPSSLSY
jgi:hypothetical protein